MPRRTGAIPLIATAVDGRPIKLEGNPNHPASAGATDTFAQASILDLYDPALSSRPWLVVANKMDLPYAKKNLEAVQERFPKTKIIPTSAAKGEGMDALKEALAARITNDKDIVSRGI